MGWEAGGGSVELGLEVHGEDLCGPPGSGLGETYCCWCCSSGPGVSTSLLQQQAAIGTGWRQCCSRCPLQAQRGQRVTLRCKRPANSQDENDSMAGEARTRLLGLRPGSRPWLLLRRSSHACKASIMSLEKMKMSTWMGHTCRKDQQEKMQGKPGAQEARSGWEPLPPSRSGRPHTHTQPQVLAPKWARGTSYSQWPKRPHLLTSLKCAFSFQFILNI